jgi:Rrf2 family transcriptional regulator, iron-sulfur cluster assembly transcription factor
LCRILRVLTLIYGNEMYLSKSCIYAIRSVLLLASENDRKFISIKEISEILEIPFHYLTKILQSLSHSKILISIKGPHGGVGLKRKAESISLYDVIIAMEGRDLFNLCTLGLADCNEQDPCALHYICYETKQTLMHNMKNRSIKDVALTLNSTEFKTNKFVQPA